MKPCECGCGRPAPIAKYTSARMGCVRGQPKHFIHGHNRRKPRRVALEDRGHATACWIWLGGRNGAGYGAIRVGRQTLPAHRIYYEERHGPIPEGLHIDHLCRVPACVNPEHLEPVTVAENARRGLAPKINKQIAAQIRSLIAGGWVQADIARAFGVTDQLVCDIKHGRRWAAA